MTNQKLRQAWQAALDIEPIMKAVAGGRAEFYRMDASLAFVENKPWYVKQQPSWGWNEHNKEKAKRLLQEAGYKGEPVRFVATQEYKWMYDFALLTKQQLEDVGLQHRPPGGGLGDARQAPQQPEGVRGVHDRHRQHLRADGLHACSRARGRAGRATRTSRGCSRRWARETDQKKRFALWEQMHRLWYEKVPSVRYGDLHGLRAASKKVQGFNEKTERPRFYNVWLER